MKDEGLPLGWGELNESLLQGPTYVGAFEPPPRLIEDERLKFLALTGAKEVHAKCFAPATLPPQVQRRIADHTQEPRLERASPLKSRQVRESFHERFLDSIQGIRLVTQQAIGHSVSDHAVTAKQFLERLAVATDGMSQQ